MTIAEKIGLGLVCVIAFLAIGFDLRYLKSVDVTRAISAPTPTVRSAQPQEVEWQKAKAKALAHAENAQRTKGVFFFSGPVRVDVPESGKNRIGALIRLGDKNLLFFSDGSYRPYDEIHLR